MTDFKGFYKILLSSKPKWGFHNIFANAFIIFVIFKTQCT